MRLLLLLPFVLLLPLAGERMAAQAAEPTVDDAQQALKHRAFPWYDSANDSLRPLRPPAAKKSEDPSNLSDKLPQVGGNEFAPLLRLLMWGGLVALLVGIIVLVIPSMRDLEPMLDPSQEPVSASIDLETLEALPEPTRGVRDLLAEASRLAAASSFESAMTFFYSWQLVQLNQRQIIEVQKGKTNRQYTGEVRESQPELTSLFRRSTRLFEDAFFGNLPIPREAFLQVWEQRHQFDIAPKRGRR
jgi:hypothetical protein